MGLVMPLPLYSGWKSVCEVDGIRLSEIPTLYICLNDPVELSCHCLLLGSSMFILWLKFSHTNKKWSRPRTRCESVVSNF